MEDAYYTIAEELSKSYDRSFDFSSMTDEQKFYAEQVEEFKTLVQKTIDLNASDEETALRWLTGREVLPRECGEFLGYMMFTDYGKELVKKLEKIVTYEEWLEWKWKSSMIYNSSNFLTE